MKIKRGDKSKEALAIESIAIIISMCDYDGKPENRHRFLNQGSNLAIFSDKPICLEKNSNRNALLAVFC